MRMINKFFSVLAKAIFFATIFSGATFAAESAKPTFDEYLRSIAVPREFIDVFTQDPGWTQFDPEVGYILANSRPQDGIDNSFTLSTIQANGARRSFMYADRKARINTYGDSMTQNHQVSDGETWQEYLAAHLGEPIRNFGTGGHGLYQAYLRMVREEKTDHNAEYLILYICCDDPVRSLVRSRYAAVPIIKDLGPLRFHGNFWANVEMDLEAGRFIEKESLLSTKESLYKMSDSTWMADHLRDDLALQLWIYSRGDIRELDRKKITRLAQLLDFPFDWKVDSKTDASRMQEQARALLLRYGERSAEFVLNRARTFARQNGKKLLIVVNDPWTVQSEMKQGLHRDDQELVDFLAREKFDFIDVNDLYMRYVRKFNLSEEFQKGYRVYGTGHYSPAGNHLFTFLIKDRIVNWLDPKPVTYQLGGDPRPITFQPPSDSQK